MLGGVGLRIILLNVYLGYQRLSVLSPRQSSCSLGPSEAEELFFFAAMYIINWSSISMLFCLPKSRNEPCTFSVSLQNSDYTPFGLCDMSITLSGTC